METVSVGIFQGALLIVALIGVLLPLLALISVLRGRFNGNEKLLWALVVIFAPFLGSILYFAIGRSKRLS
ncbi:PLD nuclease N-terminal domain-containing protein [Mangrovimonas sp. DI 80]|uniref:PLD nuclease N-terminal domain-containing protein n=1 Tax=Mangrovimonas sp. DI 80 TaxID=1779330 RepID=UPI000976672A|nr:PLD nuclease N-terminal domain-containing protein [Mangrovimonas sp. DI 80]OMP31004.1 hypothetical protein BKM32_07990 [Mangrovimonas sp. DI 80]